MLFIIGLRENEKYKQEIWDLDILSKELLLGFQILN